jgi:predicted acyl esterase
MRPKELMIEMTDGIKLQSFLYLPAQKGPFPSLLARCMYGADKVADIAETYVERGYAVLLQNVRGRHASQGGRTGRGDFPRDGYDTMDWMAAQPWCNGRIGTFGRSALARVQTSTAFLNHPAHLAMSPTVLPYGIMSHMGGAFQFSQTAQWLYFAQSGPELMDFQQIEWMPLLYRLPVTTVLDGLGVPVDMYVDFVTNPHGVYGWSQDKAAEFKRLDTPNLMITGWYDHCGTGPIDFFTDTMEFAGKEQKRNTHLVIGPWDHSAAGDAANEYDFGTEANLDNAAMEAAFFDYHLKGVEPETRQPPVKIFVMGKNQWRDEQEWPLARAAYTRFFLHGDGKVKGAWQRGCLSTQKPGAEKPDKFTYDPADPVPTWGGANSAPAWVLPMKRGARDQRVTLYRKDVLTYYSEPMERPLEVTGPLKLVLYAASSATDTDFTAKLMDVNPHGDARILSDGMVRARYRKGFDKPEMIEPGRVYQYEIDLWSTSNEFQPGHRIALAISSSNFPRINRNLNTGGDNERDTDFIKADQVIHHDERYPSHLLLPLVGE